MSIPATDQGGASGSARRTRSLWLLAILCLWHVVLATETPDDDPAPVDTPGIVDDAQQRSPSAATAEPADGPASHAGSSAGPAARPAALAPPPATASDATTAAVAASSPATAFPAPFRLLDGEVPAGEARKLSWVSNQHYSGIETPTPILVAHGAQPGKVLCVTAAVHGDEINGVEIARRVFYRTKPTELAGTLVVVPIVNLHGFERGYRYLGDRRDLNRYFPGVADRSAASRIAYSLFRNVIQHCDALVDLHTGSFHRTNLPQLRADLDNAAVVHLTKGFGATAVLNDEGASGTLRRAATDAGIPAVVLEAGEPLRFQPEEVQHGAKGIESLMFHLGMVKKSWHWGESQPIYYESLWVRASQGGILMASVEPGDTVESGQLLGTVTDPISNIRTRVLSPQSGRVLGMAVNQMVMPGYAMFRIGIERSGAQGPAGGAYATVQSTAPAGPTPGPVVNDGDDHPSDGTATTPARDDESENVHADE